MRTFRCICNNRLFFGNTVCTACGSEVAWCEVCGQTVQLEKHRGETICGNAKCRAQLEKCANYIAHDVCNRCLALDPTGEVQFCRSCRLTTVIPDLTVEGNLRKWALLEGAKRRLLFELDSLGLPYDAEGGASQPLSFRFEASTDEQQVKTGHADGVITINIDEADPIAREVARQQFGEPHRTLIGHFRHEVSHYFYMTLVQDQRMDEFVRLFGDPESPPYAESLARYHESGPPANWPETHISAYASAHPWEDFAETFAFYLDMRSVLSTVEHHLPGVMVAADDAEQLSSLLSVYGQLGVIANELNRSMGLTDLLPEVVPNQVLPKLEFCHALVPS